MFFDARMSPRERRRQKRVNIKLTKLRRKAIDKQEKREYRNSLGDW